VPFRNLFMGLPSYMHRIYWYVFTVVCIAVDVLHICKAFSMDFLSGSFTFMPP